MEQAVPMSTAFQYGVLGVVALAFAWAIIYLFKTLRADHAAARADEKTMEKERGQWTVEREGLRTQYERKHRELVEWYAGQAREEREANRAHEEFVRKEFAELMERVAAESGRSLHALVDMMQKFYDRFAGPPWDPREHEGVRRQRAETVQQFHRQRSDTAQLEPRG
jgi:hypothetical protein